MTPRGTFRKKVRRSLFRERRTFFLWYGVVVDWLLAYQGLKRPQLGEKEIDCGSCQVELPLKRDKSYSPEGKCCDFSPFVSAFAMGAWIFENPSWQIPPNLILTKLGVVHSKEHRQKRDLCHFFENGGCQIWSQRPATCFSFFCTSRNPGNLKQWEERLMTWESNLLRPWFKTLKLKEDVWETWVQFMDPEPAVDVPQALMLDSGDEARALYLQSYQWLQSF